MIHLDYIGRNYIESKDMVINRPNGSNNYLFLLFHTDIYQRHQGKNHHLLAGSMILYTPDYPQYYHNPISGFNNDWFHFTLDDHPSLLKAINFPVNTPFYLRDTTFVYQAIKAIEKEQLMKAQGASIMIDALMKQLFVDISRRLGKSNEILGKQANNETADTFRHLRSTVMSKIDYPWSLDSMAKLSNLSRSRFSTLYKELFSLSPKEDLRLERFKLAEYLLIHTEQPIGDIARKVGYEDIYQFSKYFKKLYHASPSAYRKDLETARNASQF